MSLIDKALRNDPPHVQRIRRSFDTTTTVDVVAEAGEPPPKRAVVLRGSDVQIRPVRWLYKYRVPLGKMTLLAGQGGVGKSLACADWSARITTGRPFADTPTIANPVGDVAVLATEDDPADTWVPRFMAAGGDVRRLAFIKSILDPLADVQNRGVSLATDLQQIGDVLDGCDNPRLLIVDPVSSYLGRDVDSHRVADVRAILEPLGEFAIARNVAIVLVHHLNKSNGQSAVQRVTGSGAFVDACRCCWLTCYDPDSDDPLRRLFLPLKGNLARNVGGLAYMIRETMVRAGDVGIEEVPYVEWLDGNVLTTADAALTLKTDSKAPKTEAAAEWLREQLKDGAVPSDELKKRATEAGISGKALWSAKDKLKVKARKSGYDGGWVWYAEDSLPSMTHTQRSSSNNKGNLGDYDVEEGSLRVAASECEACQDYLQDEASPSRECFDDSEREAIRADAWEAEHG